MKRFILFFVLGFMCLNSYGQSSYIGRIGSILSPDATDPWCSDCRVFALKTPSYVGGFFITINSQYVSTSDKLIFEGIEYSYNDKVIITGTPKIIHQIYVGTRIEIEIESIQKWTPNPYLQNFAGEYEIQSDCTSPWPTQGPVLKVVPETDPDAISDIWLISLFGGEWRTSVLADNSFAIEYWGWSAGGGISEYFLGEGYFENDSIFVHLGRYHYNDYDESYTLQNSCEYKGKKIDRSIVASGKIVQMPIPNQVGGYLPDRVFGLEAISDNYFLGINSNWILSDDRLIVDDVEYFVDDEVEIAGTVSVWYDNMWAKEYFNLEIETIKKIDVGVPHLSFSGLLAAYPQGHGIMVQGVSEGETITIYNAAGVAVATTTAGDGKTFIPLSSRGFYIVKAGEKTLKITL